jgi:hypothetical protein
LSTKTEFKHDLATVLDMLDRWVDDQPKVDLFRISYERGGQRITLSVERAGRRQSDPDRDP